MKQSNELFLLIKSMTRNEKGYFKKFATVNSKKGEGNYLRLFDCIDEMEEYDEKRVKKKFAKEKFVTQLNVTKLYLQRMIVKSLRNYYSENDPDIERLNAMIEITLLVKKQMYDSALRIIDKMKPIAKEYETHINSLFLSQVEYQIYLRKGMYKEILETGADRLANEKQLLREYENLCDYRNVQGRIMSYTQMEGHKRNESLQEINRTLELPLIKYENQSLSFKAVTHRLEILNKCYLKLGEREKALDTARSMRAAFKNNPDRIKTLPYNYFVALNSLANRCLACNKHHEVLEYTQDMLDLVNDRTVALSDSQRYEMSAQVYEKRTITYGRTAEYELGLANSELLKELLDTRPMRSEFTVTYLYFTAVCYFGMRNYDSALNFINEAINGPYADIRKDIIFCAHILNVMIHFDLGNYSLLKRLVTMARNYVLRHKFTTQDTEELFKGINDMIKHASDDNQIALRKAVCELEALSPKFEFLDIDPLLLWLNRYKV